MSSKEILFANIQLNPLDLHAFFDAFEGGRLIKINDDFFRIVECQMDAKAGGKVILDWQSKASVPEGIYVTAFTLDKGVLRSV